MTNTEEVTLPPPERSKTAGANVNIQRLVKVFSLVVHFESCESFSLKLLVVHFENGALVCSPPRGSEDSNCQIFQVLVFAVQE